MSRRLVFVLVALTVCAARPATSDVVYGCVNKRTGRVRSIGLTPPRCATAETPTSWNQEGSARAARNLHMPTSGDNSCGDRDVCRQLRSRDRRVGDHQAEL